VQLQEKHPGKVHCLTLNVEYDSDDGSPPDKFLSKLKTLLADRGATGENIVCSGEINATLEHYGTGLPAAYIYGADGKLVQKFDGDVDYEGEISAVVAGMVK